MEKPVAQKNEYGCGVASVAFVLDVPYHRALKFLGSKKADAVGFYCKDLVGGLKKLGVDYEYKYIKPKLKRKIYKEGTIVFIKRSKNFPEGHYLARADGFWMDPWINLKEDKNIKHAKAGFRKKLPDTPIYALFPKDK